MGNANSGRREQFFLTALLMELKEAGKDMPKLRSIAKQLIDKADSGDLPAISELVNRLDGKPRQAIDVAGDEDAPLYHVVKRQIVDPSDTGSA